MTDRIKIDTDALVEAAKLYSAAHDSAAQIITKLASDLDANSGSAGTDSSGKTWSDAYDPAAAQAVDVGAKIVGSFGKMHDLLLVTALNHANTEHRNRYYPHNPDQGETPSETPVFGIPHFDGAYGGDSRAPLGFSVLSRWLQGHVWPNGDPDKLGELGSAWHRAAEGLQAVNHTLEAARGKIEGQQSGEVHQILTQVDLLSAGVKATADHYLVLFSACADYGHSIGDAHRGIIRELLEFGATVGLAAALAEFFTGGGATPAIPVAAAARAEMVGARIAALCRTLDLSAAAPTLRIAGVAAGAGKLIGDMQPLLQAKPTVFNADNIKPGDFGKGPDVQGQIERPMLDDYTEEYVRKKHFHGGKEVDSSKGLWSDGVDLDALADSAANIPARGPNGYGFYGREVDAGHIIGSVSRDLGGGPTSRYLLVQDKWGTIRSMFPIP